MIFEAISRPSTHTMENSFVPVTHSLFCSREEIMFYLEILKAARFSLSLRDCSFFVSSPNMYSTVRLTMEEELTLNTFHLPSLAIHLITVRDLSKEESILYFFIYYSLKAHIRDCTYRLPINSGQSQAHRMKGCFRERERERRDPIQWWTLIDVWQLVNMYLRGLIYCGRGICVTALNMESVGW